jgi:hypothetical protein
MQDEELVAIIHHVLVDVLFRKTPQVWSLEQKHGIEASQDE